MRTDDVASTRISAGPYLEPKAGSGRERERDGRGSGMEREGGVLLAFGSQCLELRPALFPRHVIDTHVKPSS